MTIALLAAVAGGYVLGSIPSAAIVARTRGQDVFKLGSGNMGAMNTARNLSFGWGVVVLLLDVAKGASATWLGLALAAATSGSPLTSASAALPLAGGFGAVLGHAFSLFVRFRGGKALATTFGVSLPLYPIAGLAAVALLIVLYLLLRRAGVAAVVTISLYPALAFLILTQLGWQRDLAGTVAAGIVPIAAIVLLKHFLAWRRETRVTASAGAPPPPSR